LKSPSRASASRIRRRRITAKLVASTNEYLTLRATTEPAPGIGLDCFVDVSNLYVRQQSEPVEESHRGGESRAAPDQRPSFSDDVISRENATDAARYELASVVVAAVTAFLKPEPEAGVHEPHRLRS
jgi:hypothetical protein